MSASAAPPRSRRAYALGGLIAGAGLALVAAAQPWWRAVGDGVSVEFTGTDTTGGLSQALALVVLAGALLALVLRTRGRMVLACLLVLAGLGAVALGASRPRPSATAVRTQVREVTLADQFALQGSSWPWVFAAAGLLVTAASLLVLVNARHWPSRAARFERGTAVRAVDLDDPAAVWRSMDAGQDPTADVAERADVPSSRPDVQNVADGDTMEGTEAAQQAPRPSE